MDGVVISVSDFIAMTNQTLEYAYPVVTIEGEVSSFKVNRDKYVFFDLKDARGSIGCFMMLFSLKVALEDGMKIQITARPKLTDWGKFSLTVMDIKLVGDGSLLKSFEILKAKLVKEGLFAPERKRMLPELPTRVGVVSSTGAAGYGDFLKILDARWGGVEIDVADVRVQGERSADQIVAALEYFNHSSDPYDAIVVVRGGGSLDDLQSFNTETVARAIAGSRYPVLVGVGHEQDVTLADMAADVRASTPSNAAELLVLDRDSVIRGLSSDTLGLAQRVLGYIRADSEYADSRLAAIARLLGVSLESQVSSVEVAFLQMSSAIDAQLSEHKSAVNNLFIQLSTSDPRKLMERGYSLVRNKSGKLVASVSDLEVGDDIIVELTDGKLNAEVK